LGWISERTGDAHEGLLARQVSDVPGEHARDASASATVRAAQRRGAADPTPTLNPRAAPSGVAAPHGPAGREAHAGGTERLVAAGRVRHARLRRAGGGPRGAAPNPGAYTKVSLNEARMRATPNTCSPSRAPGPSVVFSTAAASFLGA
jgi:hypothetical protein